MLILISILFIATITFLLLTLMVLGQKVKEMDILEKQLEEIKKEYREFVELAAEHEKEMIDELSQFKQEEYEETMRSAYVAYFNKWEIGES